MCTTTHIFCRLHRQNKNIINTCHPVLKSEESVPPKNNSPLWPGVEPSSGENVGDKRRQLVALFGANLER